MKIVESDPARTFIPGDMSLMAACPPGCVRGKVYFNSSAVAGWLRGRRCSATIEALSARLVCGDCGEKPAEIRVITKLLETRLTTLPGMAKDGRSIAQRDN